MFQSKAEGESIMSLRLMGVGKMMGAAICVFGILTAPLVTAADRIRIGGYEVVDIGGVDVLKNVESGVITYYNSGMGVVACSTGWKDSDKLDESLIGGVNVYFDRPGFYQFEYMLEPLSGKFVHLEGAQIIVIKGLDLEKQSQVTVDRVRHLTYSYDSDQELVFNIPESGYYIIGFGPYEGTLLPESIVRTKEESNAVAIRFMLKRFADAKTLEETGYQFDKFVDLSFKKNADGKIYSIYPIVKGYDFMSQGPDETFGVALDEIPDILPETKDWILGEYQLAAKSGYSNVHPFGKDLEYAKGQIANVKSVLTDDDYDWNYAELRAVSAAKIGLYLWRLAGKTDESLNEINALLAEENYTGLLDELNMTMTMVLPSKFPMFQTNTVITK